MGPLACASSRGFNGYVASEVVKGWFPGRMNLYLDPVPGVFQGIGKGQLEGERRDLVFGIAQDDHNAFGSWEMS
jgi:hypothetical protein